ncbi:MAG: hypothetical protein LM573_08960, partial [Thermofilum sp.]|nr:hypothetical protein [Thermofilum sp.]
SITSLGKGREPSESFIFERITINIFCQLAFKLVEETFFTVGYIAIETGCRKTAIRGKSIWTVF